VCTVHQAAFDSSCVQTSSLAKLNTPCMCSSTTAARDCCSCWLRRGCCLLLVQNSMYGWSEFLKEMKGYYQVNTGQDMTSCCGHLHASSLHTIGMTVKLPAGWLWPRSPRGAHKDSQGA